MRHGKKVNHLSRTSSHRKAMLSNMACSLILHKRIKTTTVKAKALKVYVEPLITKSKNDTTASRRIVFSYLGDKNAVSELFREISQKVMDRPGGYTRIIKLPNRLGDNAEMCIIELVDYNELLLDAKKEEKKTTRRSRRGGSTKTKATETTEVKDKTDKTDKTDKVETKAVEEPETVVEPETTNETVVEESPVEEPVTDEPVVEETVEETVGEDVPPVETTEE